MENVSDISSSETDSFVERRINEEGQYMHKVVFVAEGAHPLL